MQTTIASHILPEEAWKALPATCPDCGASISREEFESAWKADAPVPKRTFACGASWKYEKTWDKVQEKRVDPAKASTWDLCGKSDAYRRKELRWRGESLVHNITRNSHPDDVGPDLDELRDEQFNFLDAHPHHDGQRF